MGVDVLYFNEEVLVIKLFFCCFSLSPLFPVIVCFKELVYMVMKFVRSCILRHLLLKISEHYILSQFTP